MSNYKVEFTLKQHTPIIHFQSEQMGATLRATELKPKFDRFLLKLNNQKIKPSKGPQGELYFDYKVKITSIEKPAINEINKSPLYFARDHKKFSKAKIKVEFIAFNSDLISVIKDEFPKFLTITNFGSRSSKGYGSFLDENTNILDFKNYAKKYYPKIYQLDKKVKFDTWEKAIGDFYKMVKTGNNHPYSKAYLWEYFAQKDIRWEKRQIKKEFPKLAYSSKDYKPIDVEKPKDENFRFIRAMLGLAGHYEFRFPTKETVTIKSDIKRMRSPLEFKIIENSIFILCNEHYKKLYGKTFKFIHNGKGFDIIAPKQDEFDLYEFMDYLVKRNLLKVAQ